MVATPRCALAMAATSNRPSPLPRSHALVPRVKRWNARAAMSAAKPLPWSATCSPSSLPRRQPRLCFEDEHVLHLERDQLVTETSRPLPRAALGAPAAAGLWAIRVFVVLVSLMVVYTFIDQLR